MKLSEKIKLIRMSHNLTQTEFSNSIGISRSNLANIELGNVVPTQMFINCVSLMYNVDKSWLLDDTNDDLSVLNNSNNISTLIAEKYEHLDDKYKKFVKSQIMQLLKLQEEVDSDKKS